MMDSGHLLSALSVILKPVRTDSVDPGCSRFRSPHGCTKRDYLRFTIIIGLAALCFGCAREQSQVREAHLAPVDDPLILPYRFTTDYRLMPPGSSRHYPVDLDSDGDLEAYQIQTGRHLDSTLTSILFYNCASCSDVLGQYNYDNAHFGPYPTRLANLDADQSQELIAVYTANDTIRLEILKPGVGRIYHRSICTGKDLRVDGFWDGAGIPCGIGDFTGDGRPEILITVDVGYDLYPRMLVCLDWHEDRTVWEYPVSGTVTYTQTHSVDDPGQDGRSVVFGVGSKGNAVVANGMDDQHSYIVCLDAQGKERWRRVTGGVFTNPQPVAVDYNGDQRTDLIFICVEDSLTSAGRESIERGTYSSLVISDVSGVTMDSLPFPGRRRATGLSTIQDRFRSRQLVNYRLSDDTLRICDESLQPLFKVAAPGGVRLIAYDDFTGSGSGQFLLSTADSRIWLIDSDLRVLAQLGDSITITDLRTVPQVTDHASARLICNANEGGRETIRIFSVTRTPWYTVFSRRPLLAFVVSFVPPSLVLILVSVVMVQRKKKNAVIARQRDELEAALTELKETQDRLIAAEKDALTRDIAGGVAHEIRNALDPAVQCLFALNEQSQTNSPEQWQTIKQMSALSLESVRRAISMTKLVREFADLAEVKCADPTSIQELVQEIVSRHGDRIRSLSVDVQLTIPGALCIRCPRKHAEILLDNLFTNALDAVAAAQQRAITVQAASNNGFARIAITDSGPGITTADQARIFHAFFSTKPSTGMGLGLTFAKRIAEVVGGSLRFVDRKGGGARFEADIPVA